MSYDVILATNYWGLIGVDDTLPWDVPEDLEYFKSVTLGKKLICSRLTYETLPKKVKDRVVMVQTNRNHDSLQDKLCVKNITSTFLNKLEGHFIVIGGSSLFTEDILFNARSVHLSKIHRSDRDIIDSSDHEVCIDEDMLEEFERTQPSIIVETTDNVTIRQYFPDNNKEQIFLI